MILLFIGVYVVGLVVTLIVCSEVDARAGLGSVWHMMDDTSPIFIILLWPVLVPILLIWVAYEWLVERRKRLIKKE